MEVSNLGKTNQSQRVKAEIFDVMLCPALLLDSRGIIVEANEAFQQVFELPVENIKGGYFLDLMTLDPVLKDGLKSRYEACMVEGRSMRFGSYLPMISGKGIWAVVNNHVFRENGRLYCITTLNDVSAQQKVLQELRASHQSVINNIDNMDDLVQSIDPDGGILFANSKWLNTLGYSASELNGLNLADIVRPDQMGHYLAILERVKAGEQFEFIETAFVSKDGREVMVEGNIRGQFEESRLVAARGVFRDVTYRKNLEQTYTSLIKNSPTAMYVVQDGKFKFVNASLMTLTGFSENEMIDKESLSLVYSSDRKRVTACAIASLKSQRPNSYEFRMITKDGEVHWVMETVISIVYNGAKAALGTIVDLSEHKMFEKALEEAHSRYQTLFNSAGDAIYIHNLEGRLLEVNDAACQLLGYSRTELLKLNIAAFYFRSDPAGLKRYLGEINDLKIYFADTELTTQCEKPVPVEINCKLVTYDNKPAVLTVARDITERKQIESIRLKNQIRSESLLKIAEYPLKDARDLLYFGLEEMLKLVESTYGFLYDYDEPKGQLRMRALSKETYKKCVFKKPDFCCQIAETGILGEAIRQKKPIMILTAQTPQLAANGFPEGDYKISNYLAVPIWRDNKIVGIAGAANKSQDYDASDVQQISLLINSILNIVEKLEAEKTLAESEQSYRQLVELSQDGILRLDITGKVSMVNPAACHIFGYTEEEMMGMDFSNTMVEEEKRQAKKRWKQLTSSKSMRFEREAVRKDGSRFPMEVSISRLTEGQYLEVVRDISLRRQMKCQLQESESKYRQMVENQSDLISELSPQGTLMFLNPAYLKLLGKTEKEMIGVLINGLVHPDDAERAWKDTLPAYSPPYTSYCESRLATQNGWRWIAWKLTGVPGADGKITSIQGIGRDITESKQAREELEQANLRLRELDKLKDNFLSTVSHELRTPLTSIKSFSEILLSYDEDPQTQKEFLGIINDESDRLTRLINDFLDISKIQAGRMQWKTQPVSIDEVIRQAVNSTRPLVEKEKLQLVSEIESGLPPVLSDKDRLVQVVTNLLGNAIKFTPEGGSIKLKAWQDCRVESGDKKLITVSVTDSGIGIAPENHHKIFENFGQVGDVLKDRPKGTGLGLPICKKIIESFGGKIWLESALGKGSTFYFSLPLAANAEEIKKEACQIAQETPCDGRKRILVVDDEPNIRRLIRHELAERGFEVIEAAGGKEAVDKARKHLPDLITLDISMPDLNGFDVCAVLKNDSETKHIPIVIISVIDDVKKASDLGVEEYLTKPINLEKMLQKINRLLGIESRVKIPG